MSSTRTRTAGSVTTPRQTQIQPATPVEEEGGVRCTGHGRRCKQMTAGPTTKNPGRAFYTCPLGRDDPNRCKFFKWADELQSQVTPQAGTSRAARLAAATNQNQAQTLGQSPQSRFERPTTPTTSRMAAQPMTPQTGSATAGQAGGEDEEIDWKRVDTDDLEREAIASTPGSSQRTDQGAASKLGKSGDGTSFTERLRGAVEDGVGKRKRDEEMDLSTPKQGDVVNGEPNPFLSSPNPLSSSAHPALSPSLTSLDQLSEHLHRQDRLIKAGEAAKDGFRKRIKALEDRNRQLEERVNQLEGR